MGYRINGARCSRSCLLNLGRACSELAIAVLTSEPRWTLYCPAVITAVRVSARHRPPDRPSSD